MVGAQRYSRNQPGGGKAFTNFDALRANHRCSRDMREIDGAEEAYDLPSFIAAEADTQAALGNIRAADALYERATTLVEGLLVNAPSSQLKSSMVSAFSRIYVAHFRLAWDKEHDAVKAFQIIESARGRVLLGAIRRGIASSATPPSKPELMIANSSES